jgi:hypothetical protein
MPGRCLSALSCAPGRADAPAAPRGCHWAGCTPESHAAVILAGMSGRGNRARPCHTTDARAESPAAGRRTRRRAGRERAGPIGLPPAPGRCRPHSSAGVPPRYHHRLLCLSGFAPRRAGRNRVAQAMRPAARISSGPGQIPCNALFGRAPRAPNARSQPKSRAALARSASPGRVLDVSRPYRCQEHRAELR